MSWDLVLIKTATNAEPAEELDETLPISQKDFFAAVKRKYPDTEPESGAIEHDDWAIEVNFDDDDDSVVMLDVHFGGAAPSPDAGPVEAVRHLCDALQCRALDSGSGEFVDFNGGSGEIE